MVVVGICIGFCYFCVFSIVCVKLFVVCVIDRFNWYFEIVVVVVYWKFIVFIIVISGLLWLFVIDVSILLWCLLMFVYCELRLLL